MGSSPTADRRGPTAAQHAAHLVAHHRTRDERPIRVVFLAYDPPTWNATLPLSRQLLGDRRFESTIVSLPHSYGSQGGLGQGFRGEEAMHRLLDRFSLPHLRVQDSRITEALPLIRDLRPHYIFRQRPWPGDLPPELHAAHLSFARLCYVPYSYLAAGMEKAQFGAVYHNLCELLFWPDSFHRDMAVAHGVGDPGRSHVTGYPKFDHLVESVQSHWPLGPGRGGARPFRLIWAPHWSVTDPGARDYSGMRYGTFEETRDDMIRLVRRMPDCQVVLRPHPILLERLANAGDRTAYGSFLREWSDLPNTAISDEADYAPLFHASDALLTDGVSFVAEYQLLDKPLILLQRNDRMRWNPAGEFIVQGANRVDTFADAERVLRSFLEGREDQSVAAARRRVAERIHRHPGQASSRIADLLAGHLDDERARESSSPRNL
jgi:hypothetical protein